MLNALFGSEAKVKLLNLFLLHAEDQYCITQIARDLKLPTNSVRREIDNIIKLGLVIATSGPILVTPETISEEDNLSNKKPKKTNQGGKSEKKYFKINKNFILYPEIKALFIKAQILSSQKFILSIEKNFQPKLFILTGFFTNYPEASTDILVVGKVKRPAFLKLISELEKDLGREINFTILEEREFRYRQEIMDIFLYTILEGKIITLINTLSEK
jgi:predicted transcriptional regulator